MKKILYILLIFSGLVVKAQQTYSINGVVNDEKGQPVAGAVVFITNTKIVTATDNEGKFNFYDIQPGTYEVAIRMLGFDPFVQPVTVNEKSIKLIARLSESTTLLNTVTIRGNADPLKDARIALFIRNFIGQSDNAEQCRLLNPEALHFYQNGLVLHANADDFLIIENAALGYRLKYLLTNFEYHWGLSHIFCILAGAPYFEEMQGTEDQQKIWEANRRMAYLNSDRHFFRALVKNTLKEEGFQVYMVAGLAISNHDKMTKHYSAYPGIEKRIKTKDSIAIDTMTYLVTDNPIQKYKGYNVFEKDKKRLAVSTQPTDTASIITETAFPFTDASSLFFADHSNAKILTTNPKVIGGDSLRNDDAITLKDLYIVYTGDKEPPRYLKTGNPLILFPFVKLSEQQQGNRQISVISPLADTITISGNGGITPLKGFEYNGYWSWQGIADLTPLDYFVDQQTSLPQQNNGPGELKNVK